MNYKKLKSALKQIFLKYREANPQLSMRRISELSGVNRYFLNKVVNGDNDLAPIDLDKTLALMKFLCKKDEFKEILDTVEEEVQEPLKNAFSVIYNMNRRYQPGLADAPLDRCEYFVLVLATFGRGTTRSMIQKILGDQGLVALEGFLQEEILVEQNDRIRLTQGNDFYMTLKTFKNHIPHYADFYNPNHIGQKRNYAAAVVQGLSREAIEKAQQLHKELHENLVNLMEDEKSWGDIPFFSVNFADTFLDKIDSEH